VTATDQELAQLVDRVEEAASAFMTGDMNRYAELIPHTDDYTLMTPAGGEPRRGFDSSPEALAETAKWFQGGEAAVEVVETYASGDLVVLAAVERQSGVVGGLPEQDWSLRVTLVFRRTGSGWALAHRHADPLVHPIGRAQLALLARGETVPDTP
jgi:ketosteroid isomerase-like protein